jgi:hypothetical protein
MKRLPALLVLAAIGVPGVSFADATFRQVMEFKLNMALPAGAQPGGFPFSGPTEIVARVKGTRSYATFGPIASISDSANSKIILLDTAGKRYATTSMADYLDQVTKMASPGGQLPPQALEILKNIQMKVDTHETGRSEKIFGIDAGETEVLFSMTIPLPMPMPGGNGNGMEINGKFQIWKPKPGEDQHVPALREMAVYYEQARKTGRDTASMMTKMFAAMPGLGDKMSDVVSAMQKGGAVTLRLHGEFSMPGLAAMMAQAKASGANVPSIPEGPLFEFSSSLKELNTDPVPDSVFQIPEGYQEAPVADVIKAFLPGAAK